VSDTDFEGSWAALLDGTVGYPIDGGEPVMKINQPFEISGLVLAVRSAEIGGKHGWSCMTGGMIEAEVSATCPPTATPPESTERHRPSNRSM
jgi:hypothetical protein